MPKIREYWSPEHKLLMRKLTRLCFSAEELRWLQTHVEGLPREIEQLIAVKLQAVEGKP